MGIGELRTSTGNSIKVRGGDSGFRVDCRYVARAEIVRKDQHHVGLVPGFGLRRSATLEQEKDGKDDRHVCTLPARRVARKSECMYPGLPGKNNDRATWRRTSGSDVEQEEP